MLQDAHQIPVVRMAEVNMQFPNSSQHTGSTLGVISMYDLRVFLLWSGPVSFDLTNETLCTFALSQVDKVDHTHMLLCLAGF